MNWDRLHDEDILFEFKGGRPDELTPGRFYRGTVDGFAEFGVFVKIGGAVTGLLHRSNIDGRLENLGWDEGDEVIVQVEGVRENGNVDLDWSIRQSAREFRGAGVHDPHEDGADTVERGAPVDEPTVAPDETVGTIAAPSLEAADVTDIEDRLGSRLQVTGRIDDVRQTNGPTIFTLVDATGSVECAAFEAAGVRAFPDIEVGDIVSMIGRPEEHRGSIQLETESIEALDGEDREQIASAIEEAEETRAQPDETTLVIDDERFASIADELIATATVLRRAVFDGRAVVIRHPTTVDGVVAGAALERALRALTEQTYADGDASGWFVTRRPMDDTWYDLGDAMYDVTDAADRDDVVAIVGAGASAQDEAALSFLDIYETDSVVIDALSYDDIDAVSPIATNIAGLVDERVRSDLPHLPAIGAGVEARDAYRQLAREHGFDDETIRERHEALALVAYYQRYDDKRELVADLLFNGEEAADLARHVSGQFQHRLATAVETAVENAETVDRNGTSILALDAASLTHRFAFPPRDVLADALQRESDVDVILVLDEDEGFIAGVKVDLEALATAVDAAVDDAAVSASRDRIAFLAGKREDVRNAAIDALA